MNEKAKHIGDSQAFPLDVANTEASRGYPGMTYREWLIGMATQGILAGTQSYRTVSKTREDEMTASSVAQRAVRVADSILEHLALGVKP
jgi:hypothetical protein